MKLPSKEELLDFLSLKTYWYELEDLDDLRRLTSQLHNYLMNYNSNEEPIEDE